MNWIPGLGPGRLAILPRPRGGDWLEADILRLRNDGVDILVSALTPDEIDELGLVGEPDVCQKCGISFLLFPIADRDVPHSFALVRRFVEGLNRELGVGKAIAIHCRAGIGRSSLLAACTMAIAGIPVERAFSSISEARGCEIPDTQAQREWVMRFALSLAGTQTA